MYKFFLAIIIFIVLTLAALTGPTRADSQAHPTRGHFYSIAFGEKPSISKLEDLLRLPLDPFGSSILSPIFQNDEEGAGEGESPKGERIARESSGSDAWLLKPDILRSHA